MKVVIVENELLAAEKLERYLLKYSPEVVVLKIITSTKDAITWFQENQIYDVIFMDIQLADGLSFEIFTKVTIDKPIIFTTAFDEYAVDAFKVNSVDYILKPITFTDISRAMNKLKMMQSLFNPSNEVLVNVVDNLKKNKAKDRFLVRLGNYINSIKSKEIALFYADGRTVYLVTHTNKKYILDYKLGDLIRVLNTSTFFRVNRTFILSIDAIKDVVVYSNSRLKIRPKIHFDKEIIVSRERVSDFKEWFEGE